MNTLESIKQTAVTLPVTILTAGNTKIRKGEKKGFRTWGIHFAPSKISGYNVCKWASGGCILACLYTAGRGAFTTTQISRIRKTRAFFLMRDAFMTRLYQEIQSACRKAERAGLTPCFRLNLTSDLPWESIRHEGKTVFEAFPMVQFYDYTASLERMEACLAGGMPPNYHLTFSRKENTPDAVVKSVLASGGTVACVFRGKLPDHAFGAPVVDGDENDLRFLDTPGVVVGLVEKGMAKKDSSGFVLG